MALFLGRREIRLTRWLPDPIQCPGDQRGPQDLATLLLSGRTPALRLVASRHIGELPTKWEATRDGGP